jgi:hypothetical protein
MKWQPIETAPKDGTKVKLFHTNALDQGIKFAPNGVFVNGQWQMSCYPFSKCGRFLLTVPNLWAPHPDNSPAPNTDERG